MSSSSTRAIRNISVTGFERYNSSRPSVFFQGTALFRSYSDPVSSHDFVFYTEPHSRRRRLRSKLAKVLRHLKRIGRVPSSRLSSKIRKLFKSRRRGSSDRSFVYSLTSLSTLNLDAMSGFDTADSTRSVLSATQSLFTRSPTSTIVELSESVRVLPLVLFCNI